MSTTIRTKRDREDLRRHYEIERELADRLRNAPPRERKELYQVVYDELFLRVPDHPQLTRKQDSRLQEGATERQLRLLRSFLRPDVVYLEVGAGDSHLAMAVARLVHLAYAIDVSDEISRTKTGQPDNFRLIISDGVSIDVPPGTVDLAYSHQLMEHLHPDDAKEQLKNICSSLAPGGLYLCTTPHRLSGPHDISRYFDPVATGFHLKEYTFRELRDVFRLAGFDSTCALAGLKGRFFVVPDRVTAFSESIMAALPLWARRPLIRSFPLRVVFDSITVLARKSSSLEASAACKIDPG